MPLFFFLGAFARKDYKKRLPPSPFSLSVRWRVTNHFCGIYFHKVNKIGVSWQDICAAFSMALKTLGGGGGTAVRLRQRLFWITLPKCLRFLIYQHIETQAIYIYIYIMSLSINSHSCNKWVAVDIYEYNVALNSQSFNKRVTVDIYNVTFNQVTHAINEWEPLNCSVTCLFSMQEVSSSFC
jgi:hypothetical protein